MDFQHHPIFQATDPSLSRIVRFSNPFPDWLNPFSKDGVRIRAAGVPGDMPHSKFYVARELIIDGIRSGAITPSTTVVEATSGNTGQGLAFFCNALGIKCRLIMSGDVPAEKVNAIRVIGAGIETVLHSNPNESTVEAARREGLQTGSYNPDQYANRANPFAQRQYMAEDFFATARERGIEISLITAAAGTMGTPMGLGQYVMDNELSTRVIPIVCAEKEEVPGARTMKKILGDIRHPWRDLFPEGQIITGTRHESFLLSFLSWRCVQQQLGPSFGLGLLGAFKKLWNAKVKGSLDLYRNSQGVVEVVVFGADNYMPYINLILGELRTEEMQLLSDKIDICSLLGLHD